jgi:hypothetical protein
MARGDQERCSHYEWREVAEHVAEYTAAKQRKRARMKSSCKCSWKITSLGYQTIPVAPNVLALCFHSYIPCHSHDTTKNNCEWGVQPKPRPTYEARSSYSNPPRISSQWRTTLMFCIHKPNLPELIHRSEHQLYRASIDPSEVTRDSQESDDRAPK